METWHRPSLSGAGCEVQVQVPGRSSMAHLCRAAARARRVVVVGCGVRHCRVGSHQAGPRTWGTPLRMRICHPLVVRVRWWCQQRATPLRTIR